MHTDGDCLHCVLQSESYRHEVKVACEAVNELQTVDYKTTEG